MGMQSNFHSDVPCYYKSCFADIWHKTTNDMENKMCLSIRPAICSISPPPLLAQPTPTAFLFLQFSPPPLLSPCSSSFHLPSVRWAAAALSGLWRKHIGWKVGMIIRPFSSQQKNNQHLLPCETVVLCSTVVSSSHLGLFAPEIEALITL